jgi:thiol-disulfide isomerase/thioredoxin
MRTFVFVLFSWAIAFSQSLEKWDYKRLKHATSSDSDTLYVVNFWATWCKPCVEELPDLKEFYQHHQDKKLRLFLVSLDAVKDSLRTLQFAKNKAIEPFLVLWQEAQKPTTWINQVEKTWSGSIPVTLMYYKGKKVFFTESQMNTEALKTVSKKFLK